MSLSLHEVKQQADTLRSELDRELEQKKLQEAYKLSQDKFRFEIDAEKKKKTQDYPEVITVRQQADNVSLKRRSESHADSVSDSELEG